MSAVKNPQHMPDTLPLSQMTMLQLDEELAFWTAEIASDERWGISAEIAIEMRLEVEAEMVRRHAAERRNVPFIVDDPGVRPTTIAITGSAHARLDRLPARFIIAFAVVISVIGICAAAALAGQRVMEIETRYAQEVV
ncbi:hypothetical protein ASG19_06575 [Rhizobium sp. Leaf306]|uniref:hypothetical protein n=1 Tax=Rhizobium sp. Leaf306 TaxID=1736330 RepID=UPI000712E356|nr:hypothetical protein [Rhizobium sp. Leaf306]KQQ38682.1 hypothetical protein ASG19_06575 [Rhizobium sp. Leaf306]